MINRLAVIKQRLPDPIPIGMFYPELREEAVAAFEREHEIRLPTGYRCFLTELGNGGEGPPAFGIEPLGTRPPGFDSTEPGDRSHLAFLALPFPFSSPWIWGTGEASAEGVRDQVEHGSLYLGQDGCGQQWRLIVTGPERGKIWWFCGEGIQPLNPARNFVHWYLDWLDGVEDWWTGMAAD
jgi:hypothetical protein